MEWTNVAHDKGELLDVMEMVVKLNLIQKCLYIQCIARNIETNLEFHKILYFIVVGSRWLMPPDALQPKAFCTNSGL